MAYVIEEENLRSILRIKFLNPIDDGDIMRLLMDLHYRYRTLAPEDPLNILIDTSAITFSQDFSSLLFGELLSKVHDFWNCTNNLQVWLIAHISLMPILHFITQKSNTPVTLIADYEDIKTYFPSTNNE